MKQIFGLIIIILSNCILMLLSADEANAQAPSQFNYQAVIRDAAGNGLSTTTVDIKFQIYDALIGGTLAYSEEFLAKTTNSFGVLNLQVGSLTPSIPLSSLNWGLVNYYINIQMRQGSNPWTDISTNRTQLVSVPYALHANKSDVSKFSDSTAKVKLNAGNGISINGDTITNTMPHQPISIIGSGITNVTNVGSTYTIASTEVDGSVSNEIQSLSIAGNNLTISSGNTVPIDGSITNEIQTLGNLVGNVITLTSGGSVTLNLTVSNDTVRLNGVKMFGLSNIIPAGTIMAYGGTTLPAGWYWCDGGIKPISTDIALYQAIGINYGGDTNSYFRVPETRGFFLRGVQGSGTSIIDPDAANRIAYNFGGNTGNNVGSYQNHALQGHHHEVKEQFGTYYLRDNVYNANSTGSTGRPDFASSGANTAIAKTIISDGVNGTPQISYETRPTNVYVNYIIKR